MRRHWGLPSATVLVAVMLTACGGGDSTVDGDDVSAGGTVAGGVEELRPKAAELTDQLAAHEWAKVRSNFDDNMKQKLAEDGLANAWDQIVQTKGEYVSRGQPTQLGSPAGQDVLVFDTPLEFQQGPMKCRLAFNPDGTIAGLFILVPDA